MSFVSLYCFDYKVTFTIPNATIVNSNPIVNQFNCWSHTIDIEFMTADEIIQELSGALQQVQHDDGSDDYHDVELDEDSIDELFTVTGDSDWEELGYDVNAGLDSLLVYRDEIVRVLASDDDKEEIIDIWKALVKLAGPEYVDCDCLRDTHLGQFSSMKEFAIALFPELRELPDIIEDNLDWAGIVEDLKSEYNYDEESGHLFQA